MNKAVKELEFCRTMLAHYQERIVNLEWEVKRQTSLEKANFDQSTNQSDPKRLAIEAGFFKALHSKQVQVSRAFRGDPDFLRYLTLRIDSAASGEIMEVFAFEADQVHLVQRSPAGQIEVKALAYADREGIKTLTIQRWDHRGVSPVKESVMLSGRELTDFMTFFVSAFYMEFSEDQTMKLMLEDLDKSLERLTKKHDADLAEEKEKKAAFIRGRRKRKAE